MTRPGEIAVAGLALGAIAASLFFAFSGRGPKLELGTYEVLGAVTAEETARLLDQKGAALVFVRDTGPDRNPSTEAELRSFEQALKAHPGVSVAIERVRMDAMQMMSTGGGLPAERLLQALEAHPKTGAAVMFFGFPLLADAELETLQKSGVKTVVVSSLRPGYKQLLEKRAIALAILPRTTPAPPDAPAPRTVRERFDQEFTLLTPADAAGLP